MDISVLQINTVQTKHGQRILEAIKNRSDKFTTVLGTNSMENRENGLACAEKNLCNDFISKAKRSLVEGLKMACTTPVKCRVEKRWMKSHEMQY